MRSERIGAIAVLLSAVLTATPARAQGGSTNPPVSEFRLDTQNSFPGDIFWANNHLYVSDVIDGVQYAYSLDGVRNPAADLVLRWEPAPGFTSVLHPYFVAVGAGLLYAFPLGSYEALAYTLDGERRPADDIELPVQILSPIEDGVIAGDRLYVLRSGRINTYDLRGRPVDPVGFPVTATAFSYSRSKNLLYGLGFRYSEEFTRQPLALAYALNGEPVPSANVQFDLDWRGAYDGLFPPFSVAVDGVLYIPAPGHAKVYGFDLSGPGVTECTIHLGRVSGTLTTQGTWEQDCLRGESYYRDYRFDLTANGEVAIDVSSSLGAEIALLDPEGESIASGVSRSRVYISRYLEVGSYWLQTNPYSGFFATGPFELTLTAPEAPVSLPFTDPEIVPGETPVMAVHFTELRERIDGLRRAQGLEPFPWTDAILTPGVTPVRLGHLLELRTALTEAYAAARRPVPVWTDRGAVAGVTPIRAQHLMCWRQL